MLNFRFSFLVFLLVFLAVLGPVTGNLITSKPQHFRIVQMNLLEKSVF